MRVVITLLLLCGAPLGFAATPVPPAEDPEGDAILAAQRALIVLPSDSDRLAWLVEHTARPDPQHPQVTRRLRQLHVVLASAGRFGPLDPAELRAWLAVGAAADPDVARLALTAARAGAYAPTQARPELTFPEGRPGVEVLARAAAESASVAQCQGRTATVGPGGAVSMVPTGTVAVRLGAAWYPWRPVARRIDPASTQRPEAATLADLAVPSASLVRGGATPKDYAGAGEVVGWWNASVLADYGLDEGQLLAGLRFAPVRLPAGCVVVTPTP